MNGFMVVATFKAGTQMSEVFALVAEEQARARVLTEEGRLGSIFLSLARGTVFLQVMAPSESDALETVHSLPMAKWWDLDIFPLNEAASPQVAS